MTTPLSRRDFLAVSAGATAAVGAASLGMTHTTAAEPLYKISLAEWSINRPLFGGRMQHLDFAKIAKSVGIQAIEYVNQFFKDKAKDTAFLKEMNTRAQGEGVTQVLIMCDGEGNLGDPDPAKRQTAVENHYKWVDAAKFLGCHTIRVNGYSSGTPDEQMKLVADGMRKLVEYADKQAINVVIENHGGLSSNGKWLVQTIKMVNHPRAGTLPDFGNFRIAGPSRDNPNAKIESYDSYVGVAEMMPLAKGVSVKPRVWDFQGNSSDIDLLKMMKIVVDAGYHGHAGIEHGPEGKELEGVRELRAQLERVRDQLAR
ncbi:MAG: sugar phosphate isomerase/epimerase family protein [Vicinamibacterales bacterium]|jgi:sugar phosphate isomerase/epimerase